MKTILHKLWIFAALICLTLSLKAEYTRLEVDLEGRWKFSIGDNENWAKPEFDDSDWDMIRVPARWEEEGFNGYNGYAWYRKTIEIPESFKNRNVYLELGYIDDVDEVYFNGKKIGQTGSFPPYFSTAYNASRKYVVPNDLIKLNQENTIAVRTYDAQLEGGIVRGNVRLIAGDIAIQPDINLSGEWDFSTGLSQRRVTSIIVPGNWENQGFYNYDGFAIYSRTVDVPANMANQKLIFMAGRIDDDDEFYVNGELVAKTGDINRHNNTDMYREYRNYFIPDGLVKPGKNLFEIKVVDRGGEGGIIEGSIGLITQDHFIKYWRLKRRN